MPDCMEARLADIHKDRQYSQPQFVGWLLPIPDGS